jgi:DNA-binding protein HU-beta
MSCRAIKRAHQANNLTMPRRAQEVRATIVLVRIECRWRKVANKRGVSAMAKVTTTPTSAAVASAVTLRQMAAELAERHDLPRRQAEALMNDMVALATRYLKKGHRLRLTGLGILQVRKRAARMGRNPATGEQIRIKASKKVAFRAAKELRESV